MGSSGFGALYIRKDMNKNISSSVPGTTLLAQKMANLKIQKSRYLSIHALGKNLRKKVV